LTQISDPALSSGELDLSSFLKAREFEIKALEDGMRRAKGALTKRAFQLVPWDMRRRTASHNVKRVPKRLQKRAAREMRDDNTPTVVAAKRKPTTSRGRLRAETAKRLRLLAANKKASKGRTGQEKDKAGKGDGIIGRTARPKSRTGILHEPPRPASKFRKRQIHKTWLPTHMFHAKRATMTAPGNPLWRFALPITPTQKCYRPTHRAGGERGALAWDMSYMSTIAVEGTFEALQRVLKGIGAVQDDKRGDKWMEGKRTWSGCVSRDENGHQKQIGSATIIWCPAQPITGSVDEKNDNTKKSKKIPRRKLFIRIHPAAFLGLWNEVLQISKMQYPIVHVEDLRFEIGSIELTGPGSTEALLGVLHRFDDNTSDHGEIFKALSGVTNAASLPPNTLLSFPILDPRLRYPPRKLDLTKPNETAAFQLLETLATWPADNVAPSTALFDRDARHHATRLPSQKSINRRKALTPPGAFPSLAPSDPPIPILLYPSRTSASASAQGSWTLLAPWKCIAALWYPLMHFPLSSGGNPRFAGLQELQQIHFERAVPWFPADYPGTDAGWSWECQERARRKREWEARPKGKRVAWESLDLGAGRKGEIGVGWGCDFEKLVSAKPESENGDAKAASSDQTHDAAGEKKDLSSPLQQISSKDFEKLLADPKQSVPHASLATVRITLFSRGVPQPCARIYRLPSPSSPSTAPAEPSNFPPSPSLPTNLRAEWLAFLPSAKPQKPTKPPCPRSTLLSATPAERSRILAQELLQTPPLPYPAPKERLHPLVPGQEDLIGFVTTGNYNLAAGQGTGVGALGVERVVDGVRRDGEGKGRWKGRREERLCVVRNAGEMVGRLGWWEIV